MVSPGSNRLKSLLLLANAIMVVVLVNQLSSLFFFRIDLTEEGRYSIKPQTSQLLESLDDQVLVEVFLDGELNSGFTRFSKSIREILEEFSVRSGGKVTYLFTDPQQAKSEKSKNEFMSALVSKGLKPLNIIEDKDGRRSEKIVFPSALVSYAGVETPVNLLKNSSSQQGAQGALNQSIETLEYEFALAISRLTSPSLPRVGWITGHGELDSLPVAGIQNAIAEQFEFSQIDLSKTRSLEGFDVLMIVKPKSVWPAADQYKLDQFIMDGGKVMFFLDNQEFDLGKISDGEDFGRPIEHGLDDLLFRYGLRINRNLVQDLSALPFPVVTGQIGGRSQITPIPWPFYPLSVQYADHVATRNLDASVFRFVSSIDTVKAAGILKKPLLFTSPYTRILQSPVRVSISDLRNQVKPEEFTAGSLPLAWMLEGKFQSAFRNRIPPDGIDGGIKKESGKPSGIVVFGDGDFLTGATDPRTGEIFSAGYDSFTRQTFANQELVLNLIFWLTDGDGIINARNRLVTVRMLDKEKINKNRTVIQWINLGIPVLMMTVAGIVLGAIRKRRYANFKR